MQHNAQTLVMLIVSPTLATVTPHSLGINTSMMDPDGHSMLQS